MVLLEHDGRLRTHHLIQHVRQVVRDIRVIRAIRAIRAIGAIRVDGDFDLRLGDGRTEVFQRVLLSCAIKLKFKLKSY